MGCVRPPQTLLHSTGYPVTRSFIRHEGYKRHVFSHYLTMPNQKKKEKNHDKKND